MTKKKWIITLVALSLLFFPILNTILLSQSKPLYHVLVQQAAQGSLSSAEQKTIADQLHRGLLDGSSVQIKLDNGSPAFQEHEIIHLQDVAQLLFFLRILLWILALLLMLGLFFSRPLSVLHFKKMGQWTMMGLAGIALILLLFFPFFFYYFHVWSFSNDYWLLNPQTDLLIHFFPEAFFSWALVWVFALSIVLSYLFWALLPSIFYRRIK